MAIDKGNNSKKKPNGGHKVAGGKQNKDTTELDDTGKKNRKIVFTEDGEQVEVPVDNILTESAPETTKESKKPKKGKKFLGAEEKSGEEVIEQRWYEPYDGYNTVGELVELKDAEIAELRKLCRSAFENECRNLQKQNPADAKWLLTALEKGTSRDRANSGALLVQTNPLCNLQALETVIAMVKLSNKGHLDVVEVLTELMLNSLMPMDRKLIQIPLRGADWKNIKKLELEKDLRDKIYAHWHFEDALRDVYFSFLNNLSSILQTGQDNSKMKIIQYGSKLFTMIPEKEAFLLAMLVNKLGDPSKKVAVKALYHLTEVVKKHSAMCPVIVTETEKLLFRNNISASAQHYALTFLAAISNFGDFASCEKMINVCFSFFKILTEKGEVNSRTMQAILACLRKAIGNVKRDVPIADVIKPEVLNTVYRMIHLADISIACQGLSLLLETTETKGPEQNRFYNALYRKLLDPQLAAIGPRISNIFFYIIHRAIQNDPIPERAQAFIKRLLQVAFYFPAAKLCGVLIIVNKVLRKRKHLHQGGDDPNKAKVEADLEKPSDEPEVKTESSRQVTRYDPFHRSSEYAGANFTVKYELTRYLEHFHPTVRNFTQCIIDNSPLTYYGDPLRDFSLGHFLDRFAFKNPKKPKSEQTADGETVARRRILGVAQRKGDYLPSGSRGIPVHSLTRDHCTEDERYIFQFLEQKREKIREAKEYAKARKEAAGISVDDEDQPASDAESLDDDEFDRYLDRLGVAGGNVDPDGRNELDDDVDFMNDLEKDLSRKADKRKKQKKQSGGEEDEDDDDDEDFGDWEDSQDVDDGDDQDDDKGSDSADEFSDGGSISLDEDDDMGDIEDDLEDDEEPAVIKVKKAKRKNLDTDDYGLNDREFQKKLKSNDFNSLFAAADDFSEMLEKNVGSKDKSHGTIGEIFNRDGASIKQLAWEQSRFSGKNRMQSGGKKRFVAKKHGLSSGVDKKFKGGKVDKKKQLSKPFKTSHKVKVKRRK